MPVTSAFKLRPFTDADYPRFVEVLKAVFPDFLESEEQVRQWDATWEHDRYFKRQVVAESEGGVVVGLAETSHLPNEFDPDRYRLDVVVDPAYWRRGAGSLLYDELLSVLRQRGAKWVRTMTKESIPEGVRFATNRGFVEVKRNWESWLDISTFDLSAFQGAEERAIGQGITLTSVAAQRERDPDTNRKAYELDRALMRDVPAAAPPTDTSYESYVQRVLGGPNVLPEAQFLALDGDRYVGLSFLRPGSERPEVWGQGLTGVLREYRGKGIAMALKIHGLRFAREHGATEIRTWNDTRNRPMLRINEAMGFVKQPAWIEFEKSDL